MTDANITLIRLTYDSYARRDLPVILNLLSPEIEIHQTTAIPWGGTYRGYDGAREFFRKLNEFTDASPTPDEFFAAGDEVIVIGRLRGRTRASGRSFDVRVVHIWTVRERRVVRFAAYIDTPAMLAALAG